VSVQGARQRIVRSWLDDEEAGLGGLIKEKKFIVLPAACDRVLEKLRPEARLAGLEDELIQRVREVRRQGVRGRIAAAKDELTRLLTGKDHAGVARQGAALVRSLSDGAAEVGLGAELTEPLQEIRKQSLTAWSEQAARQLADLLAKGKLIEVAREGARSMNELNDEATALANPQALERLREVRGKALRARLEAARREALALVKQDRNQAAEQLGLRTEEELGDEARAVGAESEVVAFRKTCEVFGDLARKAKKSDPK
jgi:hypothetical protein